MSSNLRSLFTVIIMASLSLGALRAQDAPSNVETRLREALRNTTVQLSDAQNQVVTLQASQAQSDKDNAALKAKIDALTAQVAALTKQSADDKAASDKAIADLHTQVADQAGQIARLNQALSEWKNAYNQVAQLATTKEEARAKLALQVALLQRTIDDREAKNIELFKTGSEILIRYEKFGLGDAIGAKEPFIGLSRVKLQELVQDYKDKLLNQTATSGQPSGSGTPASTSSAHPAIRTGQESPPSGQLPAKT